MASARLEKPLVYIGGSGRSGSTLLSLLLNNSPYVASVGEIHRLNLYARKGKLCTCGQPVDSCPFWQRVEQEARRELGLGEKEPVLKTRNMMLCPHDLSGVGSILQKATLVMGSHRLYHWGHRFFGKAHYEAALNSLFWYEMIRRVTGCPIIVDSSKDLRRLKVLFFTDPGHFRLIYLVRDGRAVAASHMRRLGVGMEGVAKMWMSVNRRHRWAVRGIPEDIRIQVQYERLCMEPEATVKEICAFIGIAYGKHMLFLRKDLSHGLGGNPMRFRKNEVEISLTTVGEPT